MQKQPPIGVRIFLYLLFMALLSTPAIMRKLGKYDFEAPPAAGSVALTSYGFRLDEVAHLSGIDFKHTSPKLDPKLATILPNVAAMGAGVSIVDYDHDGWPDIFVTNSGEGSLCHLYRNLHNGKFQDVTKEVGLADINAPNTGCAMGAIWGDYDNDGYEDLFIYKWGKPVLYHNDKGMHFTDVSDQMGLPKWINANSACWVDYDRDGKLDLFIGGYYREDIDLWHLKDLRIMQDSFEYAKNGGRKFLLHNTGTKFEDVTKQMGIDSHRWSLAVTAADLRGSGYPDLFVANDFGYSEIWENQNGKGFKEVGQDTLYYNKFNGGPKSGMNVSVGDVLNSGAFAIYVSNISEEGQIIQGNNLWAPQPGKLGERVKYDNVASQFGIDLGGWSFGAQFGDLNNDGFLDIYLVNGYVSANPKKSYWYDYSQITGANATIISDASKWPDMKDMSLSGYQQKRVWMNDGQGKFLEVAQTVGARDLNDGRSVALGDLWNRGVLDVVTANQNGPLLLYKNTVTPDNHWIGFDLEGSRANRSAIGASVTLFWGGKQQKQEVFAGTGFCSQNDHRLHFGLGKIPKLEKAIIKWPGGASQTLTTLEADKMMKIKEPV